MKILAVSGSLREGSFNTTVLRTAAELCPATGKVEIFDSIGNLPFFNADVELAGPPPVVRNLRSQVGMADALLIASPEYAHGTSGVLKNALEWLVGADSGEIAEKPVAILTASPVTGGEHAQAWLSETLAIMGARVVPEACLKIPGAGKRITDNRVVDDTLRTELQNALSALLNAVATADS
ncbi:NADPH-dependent FMN reductase [Streptomyces sp. NPDC004376]